MKWAQFLEDNPCRSAIFRWILDGFSIGFCWVKASWSLPLNLKLPNGLYFHITMEKRATLLRFSSHERLKLFLSTFFWSFYSINKMSDKIFFILGHRSRPFSDFFLSLGKPFLVDFLLKWSPKRHEKALEWFWSSCFIRILDDSGINVGWLLMINM